MRLSFVPAGSGVGPDVLRCEDLLRRLRTDAAHLEVRFGLPRHDRDTERAGARNEHRWCHEDGGIHIRLVNAGTGRIPRYSALVDTMVHELDHLRCMNLGPRWHALDWTMPERKRPEDICERARSGRPGAEPAPAAHQLLLPGGAPRVRRSTRFG